MEYNKKKVEELHLQELKASLGETIAADPPLPVSDAISLVQDKKKEWALPDIEITKVCAHAALKITGPIITGALVHPAEDQLTFIQRYADIGCQKFARSENSHFRIGGWEPAFPIRS